MSSIFDLHVRRAYMVIIGIALLCGALIWITVGCMAALVVLFSAETPAVHNIEQDDGGWHNLVPRVWSAGDNGMDLFSGFAADVPS